MKIFFLSFFFPMVVLCQSLDTLNSIKNNKTDSLKIFSNDTTAFSDTTGIVKKIKVDTLIPINQKPLTSNSFIINDSVINHINYRYAGDLLNHFRFSFIKDKGFVGQPNEIFLYGIPAISFFQDGIFYNNRSTNFFDLNEIQMGFVDSIEVIPLPRGFLFSPYNNNVSVNFITKDFLSPVPYSKIKYIQGANGEAFLDGMFSALVSKKLNASFDITNKKYDSTYTNSEFSIWQAKVRLKYFASNKINITGTYNYVHLKRGLNGGVDVDSISRSDSDFNTLFYDENLAPVVFPNRKEEVNQHNYSLRFLSKLFENSESDLNFYFRFNQDKISGIDSLSSENKFKNKVYGIHFNQKYSKGTASLNVFANYEKADLSVAAMSDKNFNEINSSYNNFSASAILSASFLNGIFTPSVFYKFTHNSMDEPENISNSYNGFGFDFNAKFFNSFKFYFGYSKFKYSPKEKETSNIETGLKYSYKNILLLNLKAFSQENLTPQPFFFLQLNKVIKRINGISASAILNFWKADIEAQIFHFKVKDNLTQTELTLPEVQFKGGIYYKDILFRSSLDLKTGFAFNYYGKQNLNSAYFNQIDPAFTVDFTLAGEIKKVAIVFFTWENLFDKKYFITPFYPMRSRNIRFGLSWELFN